MKRTNKPKKKNGEELDQKELDEDLYDYEGEKVGFRRVEKGGEDT